MMTAFEMDARIEGIKERSISFAEKLIARGKESLEEIINTYGNPDYSKTIMLSHDYPLYEYQGGLAEYCPTDGSSRKVVELTFKKRNHRVMKIWYEQNDDNTITVLDNLEWDSDKVQF